MEFDMVFEGGGAKGMVFIGALRVLEAKGHSARRLIGTSAGAITATLMAAGYDAAEMERALGEKDPAGQPVFASFLDAPAAEDFTEDDIDRSLTMKFFRRVPIPIVPERLEEWADKTLVQRLLQQRAYPVLFSFVERGSLYAGKAFLEWFRKKLDQKRPGYAAMGLKAFNEATRRDLSVVATDTSAQRMLVLNNRTAPNCPVDWAVRMSMSIPFAWQEVRWKGDWDPYQLMDADGSTVKTEVSLAGHSIVDGGVLSNFPINMLTSDEPSVRAVMGATTPNRDAVLGMLIDEGLEVPGAPPPPEEREDDDAGMLGKVKSLRTVQRVSRLVNTMRGAHDNQVIAADEDLICRLPAKTYGTMEFDMSDKRKEMLIEAGRKAMEAHLARRTAP